MPAGRPTKYNPQMVLAARAYCDGGYLEKCENENEEEVIPSVAGLAISLNVSRSTIYEWAEDPEKVEFSDILSKILAKQENILISCGLKGTFNAAIAKLALGKHGYSDKSDNTHSGSDGGPIQVATPWSVQPVKNHGE